MAVLTEIMLKRNRIVWILTSAAVLVLGGLIAFNQNGNGREETFVVRRGDFIKEISVSGKVTPAESVDLSFSETGRVANLNVKVGDKVTSGQILANLPTGTSFSELQAARANLAQKLAESKNLGVSLEEVQKEQNTLVAGAYSELLSNDLAAVPSLSSVTAEPPAVTGLYRGAEGEYKLVVRRGRESRQNGYELAVFGLEKAGPEEILDDEPTPIGVNGLFISFPDELNDYSGTIWRITVPNTKSATYLDVYNAYQEAIRTRDREISDAGAKLARNDLEATASEAEIQNAQAEVARVQATIAERTIRAPFAGIVTKVDAKLGGIASANEPAISLISADALQIESYVPEIHIPFVKIGDGAVVTLDAYGPDAPFRANVVFIDPAETTRDGVSTYRTKLEFAQKDERIKSGMTANVIITSEKKSGVIAVPQNAVISRDGQKFILIKQSGKIAERPVTVGNVSSHGEIEITAGLNDGDIVITSQADSD